MMPRLFNNRKEEKPKEEHPEFITLVEKWDTFLGKMDARFEQSLAHAEEAVIGNLIESDFDILPTARAWQGMKSQLMEMIEKIDKTFDEKVKPKMEEYKEDWDLIDEAQKGAILAHSIYERIERNERIVEGKVSQKFYDHAIQLLNEDFNCTQCTAKLEVRKDIFRSHYVSCDYCNTVNTFTPNSKIAQIQGFAVDNIAKHKAMDEWDEYRKAQNEFGEIANPSEDEDKMAYTTGFKKREETERVYWTKFLKERSLLLPEFEESLEHDLDVKMKHFYEERKRELNF